MAENDYAAQLNDRYFDGQLSPAFVEKLADLPVDRSDVRAFVERMFRLMRRGGFEASDLSLSQGEGISSLLPRMLPGAWGGRVPPITSAGRHRKIDQYITRNPWLPAKESGTFLDVGCGFPPHTTLDTAEHLPSWQICGADPSLPAYLLYDAGGNYATFDEQRRVQYFQPVAPNVENLTALLSDAERTAGRFEALLQTLLEGEPADGQPPPAPIEKNGARLLIDPARHYERDNLAFVTGGIGSVAIQDMDVVRCFNVLVYFDDRFREQTLGWFQEVLREGGLLFSGTNSPDGVFFRYFVYQKVEGRLVLREFAFSINNVCPFGMAPWYTQHDDDREASLLADLLHVLRSHRPFRERLLARSDALRAEYGLCPRGADGFYGDVDPALSPGDLRERAVRMGERLDEEGFTEQALTVLREAGYAARRNEVGHIAIAYDGA